MPNNKTVIQLPYSVSKLKWELHPACSAWPPMSNKDIDALAEDIKTNGLHDPIVLTSDGKLLDGRNRAIACEHAGIMPTTTVYTGNSILYSLSKNKHRRHMTTDQIALIAAALVTTTHGGDRKSQEIKSSNELLIIDVATAAGVPETAVKSARTVLQNGTLEEITNIQSGKAKLRKTADTIRQRNKPTSSPRMLKPTPTQVTPKVNPPTTEIATLRTEIATLKQENAQLTLEVTQLRTAQTTSPTTKKFKPKSKLEKEHEFIRLGIELITPTDLSIIPQLGTLLGQVFMVRPTPLTNDDHKRYVQQQIDCGNPRFLPEFVDKFKK